MELRTENGLLKVGSAFKLVIPGYFVGAMAIFAPMFVLVTLVMFAAGLPPMVNGQEVGGAAGIVAGLAPLIMLPFISAMQSVMFGGLVVLGVWLYAKRRPIRVVGS